MKVPVASEHRLPLRAAVALWPFLAILATVAPTDSAAFADSGNHFWNYRENSQDFFAINDSWVRPWRTGYDDGWGRFQGAHTLDFLWHPGGAAGNPLDGSLSLDRPRDHQFHAWTYLYVPTATTILLDGTGDCVPRWFLNCSFDSPHIFPDGAPASINLLAGWNRLDITGYNQYDPFTFDSGPLASQVDIMSSAAVPEPSSLCLLAVFLIAAVIAFSMRRGAARRMLLAGRRTKLLHRTAVSTIVLALLVIPSLSFADTLGNHLWNYRENAQDFFFDNDSWVRPWQTGYDDGWGEFQGAHTLDFVWHVGGTVGNPLDGSLSLDRPRDHQFHVWTYLYVPTATTILLDGTGDCVPRWFLNYNFDSPQIFPDAAPATVNLLAGWNRLDITGYNQYDSFIFDSGPLASQVAAMNTAIFSVPEPSTIALLLSLLAPGTVVVVRKTVKWRTAFRVVAVIIAASASAAVADSGDHLWILRQNTQDFFFDNNSWVRPWETGYDNGYGMFQGGDTLDFQWDPMGVTGNPSDGSLSLDYGVNTQLHVWTYLYVAAPKTISLIGQGECVPRWFLNDAFDSPHEFPFGTPASLNLLAGWNRLDITGYNQNTDFLFETGPLASQVAIMNTAIFSVPEPSTVRLLVAMVAVGTLIVIARKRIPQRNMFGACSDKR